MKALMTTRMLCLIATFGSAALLLGALAFQYLGGLAPCAMCIWQRWPHGLVILLGAGAYISGSRALMLSCAGLMLICAGIGLYHAGVEQMWWEGPSTCTSGSISGLTTEELLAQIESAPLVRCDEIAWSLLGLSMAAWNAILSLGLAVVWTIAGVRRA